MRAARSGRTSWIRCSSPSGRCIPNLQHGRRGLPSDAISWDFNAPDAIPGVIGGCRFYNASGEMRTRRPCGIRAASSSGLGITRMRSRCVNSGDTGCMSGRSANCCQIATAGSISIPKRATASACRWRASLLSLPSPTSRGFVSWPASRTNCWRQAARERVYESYSSWDWFAATHVFGTCRMGDDPRKLGGRSFGRSHRWRNLWIADASVFPSSGGGEAPSLTIQALALRTAGQIAVN